MHNSSLVLCVLIFIILYFYYTRPEVEDINCAKCPCPFRWKKKCSYDIKYGYVVQCTSKKGHYRECRPIKNKCFCLPQRFVNQTIDDAGDFEEFNDSDVLIDSVKINNKTGILHIDISE